MRQTLIRLGNQQETDVQVQVLRVIPVGRDRMDVEVERQRGHLEPGHAGLFLRFPERCPPHLGFAIDVPAELEPLA